MATLKSLVDETTNIKNEIVKCHSNLSSILTSKNVKVTEEDKMSDLIDKVDLLYVSPLYLYKDGNEYLDVTGGWLQTYNTAGSYGVFTKKEDSMYLECRGNTVVNQISTSNKISFVGYSKLNIEWTVSLNTVNAFSYIIVKDTNNSWSTGLSYTRRDGPTSNKFVDTINISSLQSSYFPVIVATTNYSTSNVALVTVSKVWLEK